MCFAYADPPYPGCAHRFYAREPSYRGEVDHAALVAHLEARFVDGWALSTSARALRDVLALCPAGVRVCAWVKPGGAPSSTRGLHNVWESVIVRGGRQEVPGVRDALVAHAARGGGALPGRKPLSFCAWVLDALGLRAGDAFADLYPGTGIVGRAAIAAGASLVDGWEVSPLQPRDVSPMPAADVSPPAARDGVSPVDGGQVSLATSGDVKTARW